MKCKTKQLIQIFIIYLFINGIVSEGNDDNLFSDSHYYRIWPYFVLVSSSSGVSESFVVKNKPPFGLENSFCQPAPRSCGRHGDCGVFPAVSNQENKTHVYLNVSNTWLSVSPMRRFCSGGGRLITPRCRDKPVFGPACQCVCCEMSP